MFRPHVISAIASRNIKTFFTNVTGYLFIVFFVVVSGIIAFGPKFFADNLATLDQLTSAYPLLLMFLIPAFTMGIWADEKRQGTDAILFTLPASDAEILFGKFFSVVVVYLAALFFSLAQLIALASLGTPDWGVILSTYIGYFLAGISLLSIGLFASSLTSNTTVAFVLGAVFCAIPVFIGMIAPTSQFLQSLSISWQLREFGEGSVVLANCLYFAALTITGLFLNYVVITERHWSSDEAGKMAWLYSGQTLCILIIAGSIYFVANKAGSYYDTELDLTAQRVNTLSPTSISVIKSAAKNRRVDIQAYISEEVPTEYVPIKKRLLRLLRQYSQLGGDQVTLRIVNISPNSSFEREARSVGIEEIDHVSEVGGRKIRQNVFLGLKFSSPIGDTVIPRITIDTPLEYELTRALGTTGLRSKKLRLGVLETDAAFLGQENAYHVNHLVVDQLKNRYDLVRVSEADLTSMVEQQKKEAAESSDSEKEDQAGDKKGKQEPADQEQKEAAEKKNDEQDDEKEDDEKEDEAPKLIIPDVLLVVRPSRVSEDTQTLILEHMDFGNPVIFMVDPLPVFPFVMLGSEPGNVFETPTRKLASSPFGYQPANEANNNVSTIFDALNLKWHGESKTATVAGDPPRPSPFGGPPQGGTPDRQETAFYPMVVSQPYRPIDDLRFDDLSFSFLSQGKVVELGFDLSQERDGVPESLGSPNTAVINVQPHGDFDPFNRKSAITSGIDHLLMFFAGGISQKSTKKDSDGDKDQPELEFVPLVSLEQDAFGVPWDDIVQEVPPPREMMMQQPQKMYRISPNPNFYRLEMALEDLVKKIEATKDEKEIETLKASQKNLEKVLKESTLQDVYFAAQVKGQRKKDGADINAVVIADSDLASNLYGAVEAVVDQKPDNVAFLMNVVDSLGGREEFVALRDRNPKQRTLTYMDRKRNEFGSVRQRKEREMEKTMRKEILRENEAAKSEEEKDPIAGVKRLFNIQTDAEAKAKRNLEIKEEQLQEELDEQIADLKAAEVENLKRTEFFARMQATILPCLPALLLGIFVFVYRFVQERSFTNERRT